MNEVKPHLSYEGQINKLREKGCIIDDDSFCRNVLVNIGYYRLSAYFLPFKSFDGTYMDNLSCDMLPPLKSLILKWGLLVQWLY
jgi:abortive infection bacteriophage resistance protein